MPGCWFGDIILYKLHEQNSNLESEQNILFFNRDLERDVPKVRYANVNTLMNALCEAFEHGTKDSIRIASEHYVKEVLIYTNKRREIVRNIFLAALFRLVEAVQKRYSIDQLASDQLAGELSKHLEESSSVSEIIEAFHSMLNQLSLFASRALQGPKKIRIAASLLYLQNNFTEQLRLPNIAKKAGFSISSFSRIFRETTGTSFVAYLRNIRVEYAKKLLLTTSLPTTQIALCSGLQSSHHFIRAFKKTTGITPGEYRKVVKSKQTGTE